MTEAARVSLAGVAAPDNARNDCFAWRVTSAAPDLSLAGLVCLPSGAPPDSTRVECLLQDVMPTSTADLVLRQAFRPATSNVCGPAVAQTAPGRPIRVVTVTRTRQ